MFYDKSKSGLKSFSEMVQFKSVGQHLKLSFTLSKKPKASPSGRVEPHVSLGDESDQ